MSSRTSIKTGFGYGFAETGIAATEVCSQLYLLEFYTSVGLSPTLAGLALALAIAIDAFADPLVGTISDRTTLRFGKRRPFILIGGILLGLSLPVVFHPPDTTVQGFLFLYLLGSYLFVNLALTLVSVPHSAFAAEIVPDPNGRTLLFGFRLLFNCLGLLIGIIGPSVAGSPAQGSWIVGLAASATAVITVLATRTFDSPLQASVNLNNRISFNRVLDVMRSCVMFPSYLPLLLAFLIASVARAINSALALYYYRYRLELSEEQTTRVVLGLFVLVVTLSIPAWVLLANRFGKKWPAFLGVAGLGVLTAVGYPLYPQGNLTGPILAAILGGFFVASIILFESLVADLAAAATLRDGQNREGIFFGIWKMVSKAARAIGLTLAGWSLDLIQFNESTVGLNPAVGWKLALLFGPGVGILFLIAALIFTRVKLPPPEATHNL